MLDKKDAKWWILEAQRNPEAAPDLIRLLAERLAFLDQQNEELRGELITLQRKQLGSTASIEVGSLQRRVQELENLLRKGGAERRLLVYSQGRIEANKPLSAAQQEGVGTLPDAASLLICSETAKLYVITADSRIFNIALSALPAPTEGAILIDNPPELVAVLDQAAFEQCRYLTLISANGYAYSLLAGTLSRSAAKQEKLLRNLIPEDPIVAALPSNNADLFAVSQKGRWVRFPEKALAATGSLIMELPKGDRLAGVVWLGAEADLIFLSVEGRLFIRSSAELASRRAPGRSAGMLFRDQTILGVAAGREINLLTRQGKLLTLQTEKLSIRAKGEEGQPVPGLTAPDTVVSFASF